MRAMLLGRTGLLGRIGLACAVLGVAAVLAGPAGAKNDRIIRDSYEFFLNDWSVCGRTVDIAGSGTFRATIKEWVIESTGEGTNDFWLGQINNRGSETHTDVATGETVVLSWVNNIREISMVYVGDADGDGVDGDWAYTFEHNGMPVRIDGNVIDVGRIVITDIIHLGNLSTIEDDFFVDSSASFVAGPHPTYFDEAAFCGPYLAALDD